MNIVYIATNPYLHKKHIKRLNKVGRLIPISTSEILEPESDKEIQRADILICSPSAVKVLSRSILSRLKRLKHLVLLSSGYDFLDTKKLKKLRVSISHCPGANAEATAEYAWMLILNLARRIKFGCFDSKTPQLIPTNLPGREVFGKTIAILGTGNVGSRVARIARAFKMKVYGYNKGGRKPKYFNKVSSLSDILPKADIVVVALPLTSETKNLIDKKEVRIMKDRVILVNVAREDIANKDAVLKGTRLGKIFGYGLDADPLRRFFPYNRHFKNFNILITPHSAYNTEEARERMLSQAIGNAIAFAKGQPKHLIS